MNGSIKNWFYTIIITTAISLVFAGCSDNSSDPDTDPDPGIPTNGRLTITGLGSYNGSYIDAESFIPSLYAGTKAYQNDAYSFTIKRGKVSGGSVTLKVWQSGPPIMPLPDNFYQTVTFSVWIESANSPTGTVTVTFIKGVGTGTYVPN